MTATVYRVELQADQLLHLGVGRGSGFSGTTRHHIPGSTLRGALCAAWWRDHPGGSQAAFDSLIAGISFSDAVPAAAAVASGPLRGVPRAAALDRVLCKYPTEGCPETGHPWPVTECPLCDGRTEPAKGERSGDGARILTVTRVALTAQETARDDRLFSREGLHVEGDGTLVAFAVGDVDRLVAENQVLRIGAARSVAGRATVKSVAPQSVETLSFEAGGHAVRVELITAGVFVDEFGFATKVPAGSDFASVLGLPDKVDVIVDRAFTRWTTASGWHSLANAPKPEDAAVVAHSAFHLTLTTETEVVVPHIVPGLGLRTSEGYGWACVEKLDPIDSEETLRA